MRAQDAYPFDRNLRATIMRAGTVASIAADGLHVNVTVPGGVLTDVPILNLSGIAVGADVLVLLDRDSAIALGAYGATGGSGTPGPPGPEGPPGPPGPAGADGVGYGWDPDPHPTGQYVIPRRYAYAQQTAGNAVLFLTFFTASRSFTCTQLAAWTVNVTQTPGPVKARMGVYSVNPTTGGLTLIGSVPHDSTLFMNANTRYARDVSVPFAIVAGQRYAFALLNIPNGGNQPAFAGQTLFSVYVSDAPRLGGYMSGQSDLPATITAGSVATVGSIMAGELVG